MRCARCGRAVFFEPVIDDWMHVTLPIGWVWHEAITTPQVVS